MTEAPSAQQSAAVSPPVPGGLRLYLAAFLIFLVTYGVTAQSGPAWQDSGIFQWRVLHFDVVGSDRLGLALSHPLVIVLGKAFSFIPFGPLPWRMNLVSAVCAAAAVANVTLLVRRLVPKVPLAAWIGGGMFGLAHTVWWLGTICESQAAHAALFTACLHVLVSLDRAPRTHLVLLLGLLNGLALTAHNLALLALPAWGLMVVYLCVRGRLPWRSVAAMAGGWVIGASAFLALVIHAIPREGLVGAVHSALFGRSWRQDVLVGSARAFKMGALCVAYNFPNLAVPLAAAGSWLLRKRLSGPLAWALGYLVLVYLLFAIRYSVADQFMFFLPFYAMVSVLAGLGLGWLCEGRHARPLLLVAAAMALLTPVIYALAPLAWRTFHLPLPGRTDLPRDAARYWLVPWKLGEDSAGRFARAALREAPSGGTIIADSTSYYPVVWVQKTESIGAGVRVLLPGEATAQAVPAGAPDVFVVSNVEGYHPEWLDRVAALHRDDKAGQVLFRVTWREGPATGGEQ